LQYSSLQKELKLSTRQIYRKHPNPSYLSTDFLQTKSVGKLIVGKFTDEFFESVGNYKRIYPSVNLSINRKILILL